MPVNFDFGEENRPELFKGKPKTPVTLLGGFLGSGKTSLLKHLLENQEGVRIGVVVNDMAAVNIDAALIRRYDKGEIEIAELENGCVCCSAVDDLFTAATNMVMRSREDNFEHIVIELSGVGEPEAVKRNWVVGLQCSMPVALRTEVKQTVTVVDSSTFSRDWLDTREAQERNEPVDHENPDVTNKARLEPVGQLLAEQVELADVVLLNKIDIATQEEMETTDQIVHALNKKAKLLRAEYGRVSPKKVLPPVPKGLKSVKSGEGNGYTWTQSNGKVLIRMQIGSDVKAKDIDFRLSKQSIRLGIKGRKDPRVEGTLSHELIDTDDTFFEIDTIDNERRVICELYKKDKMMWRGLFENEVPLEDLKSANLNDDLACMPVADELELNATKSALQRFGIHSFVYEKRRPFSKERLDKLLRNWPTPMKELFTLDELSSNSTLARNFINYSEDATNPFDEDVAAVLKPILRSKGFCWVDHDPLKQHIWAHAGKTLRVTGKDWWWSTLDKDQLKFTISYPGRKSEYEFDRNNKWDSDPKIGDKRQELVFIGGPEMVDEDVIALLDECLLSEEEYATFLNETADAEVPPEDGINGLLQSLGVRRDNLKNQTEAQKEQERQEALEFLKSRGVKFEPGENATDNITEHPLNIALNPRYNKTRLAKMKAAREAGMNAKAEDWSTEISYDPKAPQGALVLQANKLLGRDVKPWDMFKTVKGLVVSFEELIEIEDATADDLFPLRLLPDLDNVPEFAAIEEPDVSKLRKPPITEAQKAARKRKKEEEDKAVKKMVEDERRQKEKERVEALEFLKSQGVYNKPPEKPITSKEREEAIEFLRSQGAYGDGPNATQNTPATEEVFAVGDTVQSLIAEVHWMPRPLIVGDVGTIKSIKVGQNGKEYEIQFDGLKGSLHAYNIEFAKAEEASETEARTISMDTTIPVEMPREIKNTSASIA
jgi:G3E family GTPase